MIPRITAADRKCEMSLDPGITYLNHAALGPWPKKTREIVLKQMEAMATKGEMAFDIYNCLDELESCLLNLPN